MGDRHTPLRRRASPYRITLGLPFVYPITRSFLPGETEGLCAEGHTFPHTFGRRKALFPPYSLFNPGYEPRASSLRTVARGVHSLLVVDQRCDRGIPRDAGYGAYGEACIPTRVPPRAYTGSTYPPGYTSQPQGVYPPGCLLGCNMVYPPGCLLCV